MNKFLFYLLMFFSYATTAQTGCLESVNGQYPYGEFDVYCNNEFQNITQFAEAGSFSTVLLHADRVYTFKSSVVTDFLTLSDEEGTTVLVYGINTVEYSPSTDQVIRFYVHSDDQCGSETTYRTKSVKCDPGPDPNDPTDPVEGCLTDGYPNSINYTPFCNGFEEVISDFAFTGSYSPVEVTANTTYTFKSSVVTDHITITNALGTAIIKKGIGELQWTAVADGAIKFFIYLDENCGVGDNTEEPRAVSVRCGEQEPPLEGCLEAPNGQNPANVFVPQCNTTQESVVPLASSGQYSLIQVSANTSYQFYSSITTDMITIGNEAGTEVLEYGLGTLSWTSDSDQIIRFYTHANASCALDVLTRTKSIRCGEPFTATEPDFPCFEGDGLASNNFEEAFIISDESYSVADDFVVDGSFTVQQLRFNILEGQEIGSITLNFLDDNNNSPGNVIHTIANIIPSDQLLIGEGLGYYVYQVTLDLPEPFILTTGKYWVAPKVNNSFFGAFWEMTSTGSSYSNVYKADDTGWTATNYQAVFFISGECSTLSNEDFSKSKIVFSPNPVTDILKY
jgi:hypothetical protein